MLLLAQLAEAERRGITLAPPIAPKKPELPEAFLPLWDYARYKIYKGGRGSAKSWSIADALIWKAHTSQLRVLCTRELQVSIRDSVYKLLRDRITALGLLGHFDFTQTSIVGLEHGSEFIFKGLHHNAEEIKSMEGIDVAWVEEAEKTSAASLKILPPTIRKPGSELWFSYNPEKENTAIDKLVKSPPPESIIRHVTYRDNPYFTPELEYERQYCLTRDPDNYDWIWEGDYRKYLQGAILISRVRYEEFETPEDARFYYGVDWGFANDPTAVTRSFIVDNDDYTRDLYIDYEAFGHGVELDQLPQLFDTVPYIRSWPIKADAARPETISHMKNKGYNISAAKKWPGSVEDGISYLKSFRHIFIHKRCPRMYEEARLYSYKIDKQTEDVLPIIVDAWNHGWDATRYGHDGLIRHKQTIQPMIRSS